MERMQHEDMYDAAHRNSKCFGEKEYYIKKWDTLRRYSQERFYLYDTALKLAASVQIRGLRMIMENPYHPTNFTNHFWFMRVSLIDNDRTKRGDFFKKPTGYWYLNCKPTYGETYMPTPKDKIRKITAGSSGSKIKRRLGALGVAYINKKSKPGICDEERSMISPDYARNFICDFILGKEQIGTQLQLFDI